MLLTQRSFASATNISARRKGGRKRENALVTSPPLKSPGSTSASSNVSPADTAGGQLSHVLWNLCVQSDPCVSLKEGRKSTFMWEEVTHAVVKAAMLSPAGTA